MPAWSVPLFFVVGAVSQYVGAALGVFLFATTDPRRWPGCAVPPAAVALVLWRRPWRVQWTPRGLAVAAGFGVVTVAMNVAFFEAIARIPLGTAVAIEFLGPVAVATRGLTSARGICWLSLLVAGGVVLLAGVQAGV